MSTSRYSRDMEIFEYSGSKELSSTNYDDDTKISTSSVEPLEKNLKSSFSKFKGKQLNSKQSDFSDSVTRPAVFRTEPDDFEMSEDKKEETLIQRYHRLKQEVTQLVSDVEEIKDSDTLGSVSPGDVVHDLQELQKQLHQLELDKTLTNSMLVGGDSASHTLLFKELQAQVAAVKSQPPSTDKAVYEVYANLDSAKFGHLSKLSEIEGRLSILEGLVGKPDTSGSLVAAGLDTEYKDISGAVLGLQAKVALLDRGHIDSVVKQLMILLDNIKEFQSQSRQLESDPDQQYKITDALEKVAQLAPLLTLIPDLVDRLHALKDLHEHTATLVNNVANLSEGQGSLQSQMETCSSLLQQVQGSVGSNLESLQNNFTQLQTRIDKLQK